MCTYIYVYICTHIYTKKLGLPVNTPTLFDTLAMFDIALEQEMKEKQNKSTSKATVCINRYILFSFRPLMCRFDIIMEENIEVAFRPLPCGSRL